MNIRLSKVAVSVLVLGVGAVANAQNAFNSFDVGQTSNFSAGWTVSGPTSGVGSSTSGEQFTSFASGTLENITVAISNITGTNGAIASLYSDNSNTLGTLLGSWTSGPLTALGTSGPPNVFTNTDTSLSLTAGTTYWLVMTPGANDSWDAWNQCSTGQTGTLYQSGNYYTANIESAYSVQVTPEPAPFLALGTGVLPLLGLRRRAKRS